jgi:riboflavin kinase/FMN adenylyltransferase
MELVRGPDNLREHHRGCVATLGTFDGLHRGHDALIRETLRWAAERARPAVMVSFEPMPREFLNPADPPARLTNFRERWRLLDGCGLTALMLMRFGERLRSMPGADFVQLLRQRLRVGALVVGHDFRFGRNGEATAGYLEAVGPEHGFEVRVVPPVRVAGERASSSAVRGALAEGNLADAEQLLGRRYSMRGRVVGGQRLGRQLGYPTANMRLRRRRSPLDGIFAVRVRGVGAVPLGGVASLGTRPTVGGLEPLLETHVFDFDGDLYGRELEIEFISRIREERRFDGLDALVAQMDLDARAAREILAA